MKAVVAATAGGAFVVQIAAVTREEDAAALAGALRKKNYSVFVVNNPAVHDKFYHVQVGPFTTMQDAEAVKVKLTGEGYNPIVKRS
jgi:cell division septation protein DedD